MLHGDRAGAINCLAAHPHLPILATSGLEDDAKVWAPTGEYDPIVDGTPKKKKVNNVIERNQERTPPPTYLYSESIIDMLTSLLNQDPAVLQNLSDDDDDNDDDIGTTGSAHPISVTIPATSSQQSPNLNRVARTTRARIPWSLMRLIPVILGRRHRSSVQEDTSDNEYDEEEYDINDNDDQDEVEEANADEEVDADEDEFADCHDCDEPASSNAMALQVEKDEEDDDEGEDVEEEDAATYRELLENNLQHRACDGSDEDDEYDDEEVEDYESGDVWVECMDDEEPHSNCQGEQVCDQVVGI